MAKAPAKTAPVEHVDEETGEVTTALTTVDPNANLPAEYDYGTDAGAGFDNQTGEDVSVPFYEVLQPGSPEIASQGEDGELKAGMIINRTTGDAVSGRGGLTFVPAYTQHVVVEWVPREKGGGLVEVHAIDSELAKKVRSEQPLGKYKHPTNDNDLIETFYVYGVVILESGDPTPGVIAFSSTKIKPYKDWSFRMRSIVLALPDGRKMTSRQLPMWAFAYSLKTLFMEKNNYKWYNWVIGFASGKGASDSRVVPGSPVYLAAKSVYEAVSAGTLKADTRNLREEGGGAAEAEPKAGDRTGADAPY
jgi:hypothetical protein